MEYLTNIGLVHYLVLGALLATLGITQVIIHRNGALAWMGIFLILQGAVIQLAAFSHYGQGDWTGESLALVSIFVGAIQLGMALVLLHHTYQSHGHISLDKINHMRD